MPNLFHPRKYTNEPWRPRPHVVGPGADPHAAPLVPFRTNEPERPVPLMSSPGSTGGPTAGRSPPVDPPPSRRMTEWEGNTNEPEPQPECTNEPKTTHTGARTSARPAIAGGPLDGIKSDHDDWTVMRPSVLHERTRAATAARFARTNPSALASRFARTNPRTGGPFLPERTRGPLEPHERTRAPQLKPVTTCGT